MSDPNEKHYSCEADAHTLMEAATIRTDPERMADAMKIINKKKKAIGHISSTDDLRDRKRQLDGEDGSSDDDDDSDDE